MAVPVFDFILNYPVRRTREVDRIRLNMGKGHTKTAIKSTAQSRADGQGAVSSYKGQNIFEFPLLKKNYGGNAQFKSILAFLQARIDAGDEAFYFYYPGERSTPDATGVDTTGRYLVQFLSPLGDVLTHSTKHNFNLKFEETFL